jgi:hypothetical protein
MIRYLFKTKIKVSVRENAIKFSFNDDKYFILNIIKNKTIYVLTDDKPFDNNLVLADVIHLFEEMNFEINPNLKTEKNWIILMIKLFELYPIDNQMIVVNTCQILGTLLISFHELYASHRIVNIPFKACKYGIEQYMNDETIFIDTSSATPLTSIVATSPCYYLEILKDIIQKNNYDISKTHKLNMTTGSCVPVSFGFSRYLMCIYYVKLINVPIIQLFNDEQMLNDNNINVDWGQVLINSDYGIHVNNVIPYIKNFDTKISSINMMNENISIIISNTNCIHVLGHNTHVFCLCKMECSEFTSSSQYVDDVIDKAREYLIKQVNDENLYSYIVDRISTIALHINLIKERSQIIQ